MMKWCDETAANHATAGERGYQETLTWTCETWCFISPKSERMFCGSLKVMVKIILYCRHSETFGHVIGVNMDASLCRLECSRDSY